MSMSILGSGAAALSAALTIGPPAGAAPKSDLQSALDDFKKIASETPMERIRDSVLKQHGLTKDQYDALPADKKDAIDKEIQDAIKASLKPGDEKGKLVDKMA